MSRYPISVQAVAFGALAAIAACSGSSSEGPHPESRSSSTSAGRASTQFHRLGYSFAVPQGWQAQEGTTAWKVTDGPPRLDTPAFDSFSRSPDADPRILVGKRLVRDSAPLDQWIAEMRASNSITYPADVCNPVEDQGATSLGGESAQMLAFHCPTDGPKAVAVQILARHGDSGWVVQCFSSTVEAGSLSSLEQQCGRWLSSFRFAS